jgi:hypothetical protein
LFFLALTTFAQEVVPIAKKVGKPNTPLKVIIVVRHKEGQTENAIQTMNKIAAFFLRKV